MSVRYDSNARKLLNASTWERKLMDTNHMIASDIVTEAKNKYIPVRTGKLRRSTKVGSPSKSITIGSYIDYALFVWDAAKDFWRRQWFSQVVGVKRNMTKWEELIIKRMGR